MHHKKKTSDVQTHRHAYTRQKDTYMHAHTHSILCSALTGVCEWWHWRPGHHANWWWSCAHWRWGIQLSSSGTTATRRPWPTWSHCCPPPLSWCLGSGKKERTIWFNIAHIWHQSNMASIAGLVLLLSISSIMMSCLLEGRREPFNPKHQSNQASTADLVLLLSTSIMSSLLEGRREPPLSEQPSDVMHYTSDTKAPKHLRLAWSQCCLPPLR